jgi:tripartite ATP-independent transporter DctM subunit
MASIPTNRIFDFTETLVGRYKGGLGHTNVLASIIFAGMSGSAVADAAGLGRIEIEAMIEKGYSKEFSSGITIASSVIGPIIPPSVPMLIYAAMTGVSVLRLFAGGVIPGLMTGALLMIMIYFIANRTPNFPKPVKAGWGDIIYTFKRAFFALLVPVIILGGIFSGYYTPTESATAAVVYVILIEVFVYKNLKFKDFKRIMLASILDVGAIVAIIAMASSFGWVMSIQRIPQVLVETVLSYNLPPDLVLVIIVLLLLFLGCFIEGIAILVMLVPLLVPVASLLGFDPIHFGVLFVFIMVLGATTPPMGMCLFAIANVTGLPIPLLIRGISIFYIPLILAVLLIMFFPQIVLFLPSLF